MGFMHALVTPLVRRVPHERSCARRQPAYKWVWPDRPQVKSWMPEGDPIASSGHNHAPVQCLLSAPLGSGGGAAAALWCGAGDGLVSVWHDDGGGGRLERGWQELKREGQTGAW
jgi:hypothetical protein